MKRRDKIVSWSDGCMDCTLDGFIQQLKDVESRHKEMGYSNFAVELEDEWGYYDDHYVNFVITAEIEVIPKKKKEKKKK